MMSVHSVHLRLLAAVCWLSLTLPVKASVTYEYTGNPFTSFTGSTGLGVTDFISASITLPSALPANMSYTDLSGVLEGWSLTDGLHAFNTLNAVLIVASFSTDAGGTIDEWAFAAADVDESLVTLNCPSDGCPIVGDFYGMGAFAAQVLSDPGSWVAAPSAVPEPSTFGCALSAGALWVLWNRRRRPTARSPVYPQISTRRDG
jgi:hypothetical protein